MKTILVVDDEYDISEAVSAILRAEGYHVEICTNGKEALAYLREKQLPQLLVLDVMMPFLSGYEVLRTIRSSDSTRDLPVILMSSANPSASQSELRWNEFLKKPFALEALLSSVSKHAGKAEREDNLRSITGERNRS